MSRRAVDYRPGNEGLLYLRVSSRGQVETDYDPEGLSLPAQRRKCYERAAALNLVLDEEEVVDAGLSAMSIEKRKGYQQLIERVSRDDSISFVMIYATSRLNRNFEEDAVMNLTLRAYGVRLISATEDINEDDLHGRMLRGIMAVINDFQSRANGADIRYKMSQKAMIGGTPGWVPPGYKNVRETFEGRAVNTVVLDPDRAKFVPLAFEWFATGQYTYEELRDRLNEVGFRSRPTRSRPAGPVSKHTVEALLRNRYYLGYVTWNGVEYRGRHQPLVTQELFDRVQVVLTNLPGAGGRQRRYNHYLKGLLWCERCGRRLILNRARSATGAFYFYYLCRGRQARSCDLPYLRVADLEHQVAEHYRTVELPDALRQRLLELFDQAVTEALASEKSNQQQLRRRLTELGKQEDRYIELALDPDWPRTKLAAKLRDIRDERAQLEGRLAHTAEQLAQGVTNARAVLGYLERPYELYGRCDLKNRTQLNRLIFGRLRINVVDDQPQVSSDDLTEPFAAMVYLRRNWSPGWDRAGGVSPKGVARPRPSEDTALTAQLVRQFQLATPHASSSSSTLAEDARFELARGCPQHAFQACALGQLGESSAGQSNERERAVDGVASRRTTRLQWALTPRVALPRPTPPGPEGSKGKRALAGARGVPNSGGKAVHVARALPEISPRLVRGGRWPGARHRAARASTADRPDPSRLSLQRSARLRQDQQRAHPRALAQLRERSDADPLRCL
jgi:site-specific DNA recombinase